MSDLHAKSSLNINDWVVLCGPNRLESLSPLARQRHAAQGRHRPASPRPPPHVPSLPPPLPEMSPGKALVARRRCPSIGARSAVAPAMPAGGAADDNDQVLADGGVRRRWCRRTRSWLRWARAGRVIICPWHRPNSDVVSGISWDLPATQVHLGHRSKAWRWWAPPSPKVVDQSFVVRLPDFAIRHLVPASEEWLLMKTTQNFSHGGRWWRMRVATLFSASLVHPSPHPGYFGRNPRSGSPDQTMATLGATLEGIIFVVDAA
jgi:hypothetical protein